MLAKVTPVFEEAFCQHWACLPLLGMLITELPFVFDGFQSLGEGGRLAGSSLFVMLRLLCPSAAYHLQFAKAGELWRVPARRKPRAFAHHLATAGSLSRG